MDRIDTKNRGWDGTSRSVVIIIVAVVSVILVTSAISVAALFTASGAGAEGSNASGILGNGPISVFTVNNTSFNEMNSIPSGVSINNATNTINVTSRDVTLVIEAAPTWYPRNGDFWLLYGLVNPHIVIKQGVTVHFIFINMDNKTHVPAITTIGPPYGYMPMEGSMIGSDSGSGMMGYQGNTNNALPAIGPMLVGTSAQTHDPSYAATSLQLSFNSPGNFWYICLVPGHAQMGMYGNISVQQY